MKAAVYSILLRYAAGEISAWKAAGMMGDDANVADVIVQAKRAGLKPPRPPAEQEAAELARALRVLGLDHRN